MSGPPSRARTTRGSSWSSSASSGRIVERASTSTCRSMNFYDNSTETTGEMLERFFPGQEPERQAPAHGADRVRERVHARRPGHHLWDRVLPISWAPASSTFRRGLRPAGSAQMTDELRRNGVELPQEGPGRAGARGGGAGGQGRLRGSWRRRPRDPREGGPIEREHQEHGLPAGGRGELPCAIRRGSRGGSNQLELLPGLPRHPQGRDDSAHRGPGLHVSEHLLQQRRADRPAHDEQDLLGPSYPDTRPGSAGTRSSPRSTGLYSDWNALSEAEYAPRRTAWSRRRSSRWRSSSRAVREKIDWKEAATPRTIERYTTHFGGTSFGTKFEGLRYQWTCRSSFPACSTPGPVGIIMSGWLGTIQLRGHHGEQD